MKIKRQTAKRATQVKSKVKTKARAKAQSKPTNSIAVKLQKEVAAVIAAYMNKHDIGFNEFARRLGTSATQMQKIQKGSANLTLASLGHIASVMKKKVKLSLV